MADIIKMFKIEYDRPGDAQHYTAFIGALDPSQATDHVYRRAGRNVQITSQGMECRIDEFTPEVINLLKSQLRIIEPPVGPGMTAEEAILREQRNLDAEAAAANHQVKGKPTLRG